MINKHFCNLLADEETPTVYQNTNLYGLELSYCHHILS